MSGEGEFDMASAVAEVSSSLGFSEVSDNTDMEVVPGSGAGEGKELAAGDAVEGAAPESSSEPSPAPTPEVVAPRTWRAEAAAEFAKLPEVVRNEIMKREEDIFKGIEGYKADAAFGKQMQGVLNPYMATLQQYNIKPEAQVADMMQTHYTLAFGTPEQKVALFQKVAADYGVDLQAVAAGAPYVDPQVQALQNQLRELQSHITRNQARDEQRQFEDIQKNVEAFAAKPENIYFDELANDIAALLRSGVEKTLEGAYEKALWSNPAVRAKELARQQAEKAEIERKAAEQKAADARKATSANVKPRTKSGSATAPLGSMDDTLNATLADIRARSS